MSKCTGCDQHNAVIYDDEDMYCHDCYNEKLEIEEYEQWVRDSGDPHYGDPESEGLDYA
jgi:hypothetical protein